MKPMLPAASMTSQVNVPMHPSPVGEVLRLIKFSHSVFALPFAIVAFLSSPVQPPPFGRLVLMIVAVVFARSAAMSFNRIVDLPFDRRNPRTHDRQLVQGTLTVQFAWIFTAVSSFGFLAAAWFLGPVAAALSVPTLLVLFGYSYTKRFTRWSHAALGLALGLAPMGAWVAATGGLGNPPVLLAAAVLCWVFGFDILYATQDEAFDRDAGLHSMVVALGRTRALWVARLAHLLVPIGFVAYGILNPILSTFYLAACAVVSGLLIWQHCLVRPTGDLSRVNLAFFELNGWISFLILAGASLDCAGVFQ